MLYDVLIIGAGPAGLSAGLYSARATLKTLIIEKAAVGGLATTTTEIENYPGVLMTTGPELTQTMKKQCDEFGAETVFDEVTGIKRDEDGFFTVKTRKTEYRTKTVIIATGSEPRELGIPGEKEYRGMGVSYCATCDAGFFRGFEVCVVGGGDTALKEALYLSKFASKVTIIHRRDQFRGGKNWEVKVRKDEKIHLLLSHIPLEIVGENSMVTGIKVKNLKTDEEYVYPTDGVFMFVGNAPNSAVAKDLVDTDGSGHILTDDTLKGKTEGVFVAGDVRKKELRQVVTAASDGAICAVRAEEYIENLK